eukprot:10170219-Lingulodinium_polyedra.AAC.1
MARRACARNSRARVYVLATRSTMAGTMCPAIVKPERGQTNCCPWSDAIEKPVAVWRMRLTRGTPPRDPHLRRAPAENGPSQMQ